MNVRRPHTKISNKNIAQTFVIVLPGVNGDMVAILIEDLRDQTKPDYLRACAEDGHYSHKTYLAAVRNRAISSLEPESSSRSSGIARLSSFEEYSPSRACSISMDSRSSGRTGIIT